MILHIKVMDGELNATPRGCVNVPDTLPVGGVPVRVAGATEGAHVPRQLSTTTLDEPLHLKSFLVVTNSIRIKQHMKLGACGAP